MILTISVMPFVQRIVKLSAIASELIVGLNPLCQCCKLRAGKLCQRAKVQSIDRQNKHVHSSRKSSKYGSSSKIECRCEKVLEGLQTGHIEGTSDSTAWDVTEECQIELPKN